MSSTPPQVREHYSTSAQIYRDHYDPEKLLSSKTYPAEFFRLRNLLGRLQAVSAARVVDAGCGEGTPMLSMRKIGCEVRGFDITPEMIEKAKELLKQSGLDPRWARLGDIENLESFQDLQEGTSFDAAVCFGVMPHVGSELASLKNLRAVLREGGRAFVEFRNQLFNLFTLNRYTLQFYIGELLRDSAPEILDATRRYLETVLAMDKPPLRLSSEGGKPGYDAIQAKMHNPFLMPELFKAAGFGDLRIHWYHFHPTLPFLEGVGADPASFRQAAFAMEENPADWRGHFLCSAYVVEAVAK